MGAKAKTKGMKKQIIRKALGSMRVLRLLNDLAVWKYISV